MTLRLRPLDKAKDEKGAIVIKSVKIVSCVLVLLTQ